MNVTDPGGAGTGLPSLLATIVERARARGADAALMVATSMRESGLRWDALGDYKNGVPTSFGPFQHHIGGALGNHPSSWAMSPAGVDERAQAFAAAKARSGADAAAVQRPADPAGYARAVDANLPQARQLVASLGATATPAPATAGSSSGGGGVSPGSVAGAVGGAVTGAVGAGVGAVSSAAGWVADKVFDWDAVRRLVLGALIVAGGVALVVTGGYQATRA